MMADENQMEYDESGAEQPVQGAGEQPQAASDAGSELPVKEGAVFGVGAFLLSYLTSLAVVIGTFALGGVDADDMAASWEFAAWGLLSGLGATFEVDGEVASLVSAGGGFGNVAIVFILVPLVVLLAAGYSMAKYTDATDAGEAAKAGALVVPGWLVLAVIFSVVAEYETDAEVTMGVATGDAVLYAGVLIPALFAIAGGLLYSWPDPVEKAMEKIDG